MSGSLRQSRLPAGLPFDVSLKIFSECDVDDVLNLSATCKRLNEASREHQTWLDQVKRLGIPIPTGVVPSTAELKNWVLSWLRSDKLWVKPRDDDDDDDDDRSLSLHWFNMRQEDPDDEEEPTRFVMANLMPGGKFVVVLYTDGQIDLKEIKIDSRGKWDLRDVARHEQEDPEEFYTMFWSQLLTETSLAYPLVAIVDQARESGSSLLVFLVNQVAGVIERKQVVDLGGVDFYGIYGIHARGNIILCFYEYSHGWGITVSGLGPDPALKHFTLSTNLCAEPKEVRFFMVSENAVVICDAEGIHLYHIPELNSAEDLSTLSPVWEWPGESKWFCGGACTTYSQHPVLYLQGTSGTHTITFRVDACGRDPVVVKHTTGKLPVYLAPLEGDEDSHRFVMKGRKGLYYNVGEGIFSGFATCLLGGEELMSGFSADVDVSDEREHEVTLADFDERTGRILISTDWYGAENEGQGIRIYLADLPP